MFGKRQFILWLIDLLKSHLSIEKYMRNGIILIQFPVYSTACGIIMKTCLQIQLQREKLKKEIHACLSHSIQHH